MEIVPTCTNGKMANKKYCTYNESKVKYVQKKWKLRGGNLRRYSVRETDKTVIVPGDQTGVSSWERVMAKLNVSTVLEA